MNIVLSIIILIIFIVWFLKYSRFSIRGNIKWIIRVYDKQRTAILNTSDINGEDFDSEVKNDLLLLVGRQYIGYSGFRGDEYNGYKNDLEIAIKKKKVRSLEQLINLLLDIAHPIPIGQANIWTEREIIVKKYCEKYFSKYNNTKS